MEIQPFTLPEVPILRVFSYLDPLTLYRVGLVCRRFRELSSARSLWERAFINAPAGLPKTREMAGYYLTGRLFSIPPKVTYTSHMDLLFPPKERDDYIAWRHSSHPFKSVRIDDVDIDITHFSQHDGTQTWVAENNPSRCYFRDQHGTRMIDIITTGFIASLVIFDSQTLVVELMNPSTVCLINHQTQVSQTIPGDLIDIHSPFLLIYQPEQQRLILINHQKRDVHYYPFCHLGGKISLMPNGQEILYRSHKKLYLKNLDNHKRKCVFSWHPTIHATHQTLSPDGIHCALVLKKESANEHVTRPTNHLVVINLNTCQVVFCGQIKEPDIRLGELYFSKDQRSVVLYGSRKQTTFEFGNWACFREEP